MIGRKDDSIWHCSGEVGQQLSTEATGLGHILLNEEDTTSLDIAEFMERANPFRQGRSQWNVPMRD
jgi:hypothetical protein